MKTEKEREMESESKIKSESETTRDIFMRSLLFFTGTAFSELFHSLPPSLVTVPLEKPMLAAVVL